jgi:hypothetical protein
MGKLAFFDPSEAYQPDTRLRLGMGVKASGVGGRTMSAGERYHSRFSLPPSLAPAQRTITHPSPAVPLTADDVLLSLSAKKKVKVQRTQDYLKNRVLLRSYTQATAQASYDYNLRTEKASAGRQTQQVYIHSCCCHRDAHPSEAELLHRRQGAAAAAYQPDQTSLHQPPLQPGLHGLHLSCGSSGGVVL